MGRTIIPLDLAKSYAKDGSSSQFGDRKVGEKIARAASAAKISVPQISCLEIQKINAWPRKEMMPGVLDHAFHLGLARNNKRALQLRIQSAFDPCEMGLAGK